MSFIHPTELWLKGENFEGLLVFIAGLCFVAGALVLWKFGTTPNARSLIVPFLVLGLLFSGGISALYVSNQSRLTQSQAEFADDPAAFVASEKQRVEGFQSIYTYSAIFSGLCFLLSIFAFLMTENRTFQSICIALMLLGVSLIIIDFFSKERAQIYYAEILKGPSIKD